MNECPNCSTKLEDRFQFCPQCSQSTHVHRFNLPHLFHEIFHAFTHADKGVLYLAGQLARRPGTTARRYVLEGQRKRYFNPFTFLLLVLGLTIFVNTILHPYSGEVAQTNARALPKFNSEQARQRYLAVAERRLAATTFLEERSNVIFFLVIPILALVFWLLFIRSGLNYAEHLVALVFFAGFMSLAQTLVLIPLFGLLAPGRSYGLQAAMLLFHWIYLTIAYYQFLNYQRPVKYLRTGLVSLLALTVWFILSGTTFYLYTRFG